MGISDLASEAAQAAHQARRRLIVALLAGGLGLTAAGFATAAGFIVLTAEVGSVSACLFMAGFFLLAALIVVVLGRSQTKSSPAPPRPHTAREDDAFVHLLSTFVAGVRAANRRHDTNT